MFLWKRLAQHSTSKPEPRSENLVDNSTKVLFITRIDCLSPWVVEGDSLRLSLNGTTLWASNKLRFHNRHYHTLDFMTGMLHSWELLPTQMSISYEHHLKRLQVSQEYKLELWTSVLSFGWLRLGAIHIDPNAPYYTITERMVKGGADYRIGYRVLSGVTK